MVHRVVTVWSLVGCLLTTTETFANRVHPAGSPAETRQRLQDTIEALPEGGELILAGGRYEIDQPIRFRRPATLRAAAGAQVTFSGGRQLTLTWKPHDGNVLRADLPVDFDLATYACDQLYLNGRQMHLARYPNFDPAERFFGGVSADALSAEKIASWARPAGGFIHSLHRSEWGGNHWLIKGKKSDGTLDLEGGWMNNRPSGINPQRRFVENIFEELDAPGEWYLDREERVVYLYPPADIDVPSATTVFSGIDRLIEIVGESPAKAVEKVRVQGLRFADTARTFMKSDEALLRSDWMIHRSGAVFVENAAQALIEDCVFHRLGGNGLFVSGHAKGIEVRGCHLSDIGASGVCFVGKPEAVRSPSFNYHEFVPIEDIDRTPGPKTEDYPRDCVVEDCLIHDIGVTEKQPAGVQISMAARITVRHVSIYDTPRAGINVSEGTWGGHVIEHCDVFDTVQMTGDHGSFNSWGRDRFWHPNRATLEQIVSEHPELILLDAIEPTVIRNSRWRCDHGWDIDLDDGASNYQVYNNLCLAGGIKVREGFHRHVYNNIMVNNSVHPHVWFKDSHDRIERNVVMTWYRPIRVPEWGDNVDSNLLPDRAALARSRALGLDRHSVAGEPRFVSPETGDFRVSSDSPALSIGFENFPTDQFGVQKPSLREVARTPVIPVLGIAPASDDTGSYQFLGASVKKLEGLGERSATGMDSERGVLVLSAPEGSVAARQGLRENDVLLRVGGFAVDHPTQLQVAYLKTESTEDCDFVLFRDQREQTLAMPGVLSVRLEPADAVYAGGVGLVPSESPPDALLEVRSEDAASIEWKPRIYGALVMDVYLTTDEKTGSAPGRWSFEIAGQTLTADTAPSDGRRHRLGQVRFERYGVVPVKLRLIDAPDGATIRLGALTLERQAP